MGSPSGYGRALSRIPSTAKTIESVRSETLGASPCSSRASWLREMPDAAATSRRLSPALARAIRSSLPSLRMAISAWRAPMSRRRYPDDAWRVMVAPAYSTGAFLFLVSRVLERTSPRDLRSAFAFGRLSHPRVQSTVGGVPDQGRRRDRWLSAGREASHMRHSANADGPRGPPRRPARLRPASRVPRRSIGIPYGTNGRRR